MTPHYTHTALYYCCTVVWTLFQISFWSSFSISDALERERKKNVRKTKIRDRLVHDVVVSGAQLSVFSSRKTSC